MMCKGAKEWDQGRLGRKKKRNRIEAGGSSGRKRRELQRSRKRIESGFRKENIVPSNGEWITMISRGLGS